MFVRPIYLLRGIDSRNATPMISPYGTLVVRTLQMDMAKNSKCTNAKLLAPDASSSRRGEMAPLRYADFKPQTQISDCEFTSVQTVVGIELTASEREIINLCLKEYEYFRVLRQRGEGLSLKKALLELEASTERYIDSIEAVTKEPGHIWEQLLGDSGANVTCLPALLAKCRVLNRRVARAGRKKDFHLDSLLLKLDDIFQAAKSRTGENGRGTGFLRFAFEVTKFLPQGIRPHSRTSLERRWERLRREMKESRRRVHMWVGEPCPGLARSWFGM
jgi:hypothetical protein